MPYYEYGCKGCGKKFELLMKFSDPDPETCPDCGQKDIEKLISKTGFVLKGGGWYAQGYSDSGKKPATTSDKANADGPSDSSAKPTEKTADSKVAAAPSAPSEKKAESKKD